MKSLMHSYDTKVESAYVITVKGNEKSERYAQRCLDSCNRVNMPCKIWHAYDGTGGNIIPPDHLKDDMFMNSLKLTERRMTPTLTSCALSHISLWLHCMAIDRPIVILEHDAIFVKAFVEMQSLNSIVYLGNKDYFENKMALYPIPILGSDGFNSRYLYCAHAYAVDPLVCKRLLAHVLEQGIYSIPDRIMRADLFNITHQGIYAYEDPFNVGDTTVVPVQD